MYFLCRTTKASSQCAPHMWKIPLWAVEFDESSATFLECQLRSDYPLFLDIFVQFADVGELQRILKIKSSDVHHHIYHQHDNFLRKASTLSTFNSIPITIVPVTPTERTVTTTTTHPSPALTSHFRSAKLHKTHSTRGWNTAPGGANKLFHQSHRSNGGKISPPSSGWFHFALQTSRFHAGDDTAMWWMKDRDLNIACVCVCNVCISGSKIMNDGPD